MALTMTDERLISLLPEWHLLLQRWSTEGALLSAAREALLLEGEPQTLKDLLTQWSSGDFSEVPPIVLLSASDINGAMGAYASSTGTIYLNADWLATATQEQANAVLTEELGHYLDGLLNFADTAGDEGEIFARLLSGQATPEQLTALRRQDDHSTVQVAGETLTVENSVTGTLVSTPIAPSLPGRTSSEFRNRRAFAALRDDGQVFASCDLNHCGDSSGVDLDGANNNLRVTQVFSNPYAFAALRSDGSVVSCGNSWYWGTPYSLSDQGNHAPEFIPRTGTRPPASAKAAGSPVRGPQPIPPPHSSGSTASRCRGPDARCGLGFGNAGSPRESTGFTALPHRYGCW